MKMEFQVWLKELQHPTDVGTLAQYLKARSWILRISGELSSPLPVTESCKSFLPMMRHSLHLLRWSLVPQHVILWGGL